MIRIYTDSLQQFPVQCLVRCLKIHNLIQSFGILFHVVNLSCVDLILLLRLFQFSGQHIQFLLIPGILLFQFLPGNHPLQSQVNSLPFFAVERLHFSLDFSRTGPDP